MVIVNNVSFTEAPLSEAESSLWMFQQLFPDMGASNIGFFVRFAERVSLSPLRQAARWVVQRHRMLGSFVITHGDHPVRLFREPGQCRGHIEAVTTTSDCLEPDLRQFAARAFDLARDELIRFALFELPDGQQVVAVAAHHLVFDAMSILIVAHDLAGAYESFAVRAAEPLAPPAFVNEPAALAPSSAGLSSWRAKPSKANPEAMHLDAVNYSVRDATFHGARYDVTFTPEAADAVRRLRHHTRASDNAILLAGYLLALHRHGAERDLVTGVHFNLRRPYHQPVVGHYITTLPLKTRIEPEYAFRDLVRAVQASSLIALRHRGAAYETILSRLNRKDYDWQAPLFRHTFTFIPTASGSIPRHNQINEIHRIDTGFSRFDIEFVVTPWGDEFDLQIAYRSDFHDLEFIRRLSDRYQSLLISAANNPGQQVSRLPMATVHDRVIALSNQSDIRWSGPDSVPGMISTQAHLRPHATALMSSDGQWTYRDLFGVAAELSRQLADHGVGPGTVVGVEAAHDPVVAAAALAAWKLGAAYLPLSPDHPGARLAFQLHDARAVALVVRSGTDWRLDQWRGPLVEIPPGWTAARSHGEQFCGFETDPDSLAYVIYTSGSTGKPKAVGVTHANLSNLIRGFAQFLQFDHRMAMLWLTTFIFDISALELFLPLAQGGRVVAAPHPTRIDPDSLIQLISRAGVDVVQATPTMWRLIIGHGSPPDLSGRQLLCGGEPLTPALARQLMGTGGRLINAYGPTETTIWSTACRVIQETGELAPSVGRPIANTRIAIVDRQGNDCPVGIIGEVLIGGAGVAAGYISNRDLTRQRFVRHGRIGRAYRTGDLGYWRPDGQIQLLGRADLQVKINGHRIELGEVEAILAEYPGVEAAAVVRGSTVGRGDFLRAFVVGPGLGEPDVGSLWDFASRRLPEYALPGAITVVDQLPTGPTGKVDYRSLEIRAEISPPTLPVASAVAPAHGDVIIESLVAMWRQLCCSSQLDQDSNLFLSGGNSLSAVSIVRWAKEEYAIDLPYSEIFKQPTPRLLARALRERGAPGACPAKCAPGTVVHPQSGDTVLTAA